ncbi:MAG: hypothetical protein HZC29_00190 [Thaumarchaeota archaeon]|nr:hypothetical protein [Nitrososphaerota archaeon]
MSYGTECSDSVQTESNILDQSINLSEKPTRVNLQIDIENDSDNITVYDFLREVEGYSFRTTVYVTKEFALKFPDIVRDIRLRGHEIGLHGDWDNNLSYNEQVDLRKDSVAVLKNISMQDIIHYTPKNYKMSYERDNAVLRAAQAAGLQTITAYITVNNSFPCCYSQSLGRVGRPMHLPEGIIAIPISVIDNGTENITLVDNEFDSSDVYLDYLLKKYNESSESKEPMIIVVHPPNSSVNFQPFVKLLKYIVETKGLITTTSYMMGIANPYISGLSASGPETACKNEKIQISVSYTSNILVHIKETWMSQYPNLPLVVVQITP